MYETLFSTAASAFSALRPRWRASVRTKARASCSAFSLIVLGRSCPSPPTGCAAPVFVPGAIAATSPAISRKKPADAAWAPDGATKVATGTFDARIAEVMSRVEARRPPGVERRSTTSDAPSRSA